MSQFTERYWRYYGTALLLVDVPLVQNTVTLRDLDDDNNAQPSLTRCSVGIASHCALLCAAFDEQIVRIASWLWQLVRAVCWPPEYVHRSVIIRGTRPSILAQAPRLVSSKARLKSATLLGDLAVMLLWVWPICPLYRCELYFGGTRFHPGPKTRYPVWECSHLRDFGLPPGCSWRLRSSGMLRSVDWWFAAVFTGQSNDPYSIVIRFKNTEWPPKIGPILCSETSVTNH